MSVIESIYAYNNSAELTRNFVQWTTYPLDGNILTIGANSNRHLSKITVVLQRF